jgi:hypothetical protein
MAALEASLAEAKGTERKPKRKAPAKSKKKETSKA